jgi:hypothetical protein
MDKRRADRFLLNVYLEVRDAETGREVGRIVDLTTQGMRLITGEPLTLDSEHTLVIVDDHGHGRPEELHVDARCVWVGKDVNPALDVAGFVFEDVRPRQESLLARIIRRHRFDAQKS